MESDSHVWVCGSSLADPSHVPQAIPVAVAHAETQTEAIRLGEELDQRESPQANITFQV